MRLSGMETALDCWQGSTSSTGQDTGCCGHCCAFIIAKQIWQYWLVVRPSRTHTLLIDEVEPRGWPFCCCVSVVQTNSTHTRSTGFAGLGLYVERPGPSLTACSLLVCFRTAMCVPSNSNRCMTGMWWKPNLMWNYIDVAHGKASRSYSWAVNLPAQWRCTASKITHDHSFTNNSAFRANHCRQIQARSTATSLHKLNLCLHA